MTQSKPEPSLMYPDWQKVFIPSMWSGDPSAETLDYAIERSSLENYLKKRNSEKRTLIQKDSTGYVVHAQKDVMQRLVPIIDEWLALQEQKRTNPTRE